MLRPLQVCTYIYIFLFLTHLPVRAQNTDSEKFIVSDDEEEELETNEFGAPLEGHTHATSNPHSFSPIHIITQWRDPRSKDLRCTVAILLPSGVAERIDDLVIQVVDSTTLQVSIPWPSAFMKTEKLMHIWLEGQGVERIESYHPHCESFNDYRMQYQKREDDNITSTARFALPFDVMPEFEQHLLGWEKTSEEIVLVVLKSPPKDFRKDAGKLQMKRAIDAVDGPSKTPRTSTVSSVSAQ